MTTISVPLSRELLDFIDRYIKKGSAENRAQTIRQALRIMKRETEMLDVLEASLQVKKGIYYEGDLKKIIKARRNA